MWGEWSCCQLTRERCAGSVVPPEGALIPAGAVQGRTVPWKPPPGMARIQVMGGMGTVRFFRARHMRCVTVGMAFVLCALVLAGCSRYEIVRLEESDYRPPTPPPLAEMEKKEYVRGYNEGWRQYASRWYCKDYPDGDFATHGEWIQCAKDGSPFQQGFEDGQCEAGYVGMVKLYDRWTRGRELKGQIPK